MNFERLSGINLEIADIIIALASRDAKFKFSIGDNYLPFITDKPPQLNLNLYFKKIPRIELGRKIFYTDSLKLYRNNGRYIFSFRDNRRLTHITAITDRDFQSLDLYYRRSYRKRPKKILALDYPFDALLWVNLLSQRDGLLVHACGIKINNKGYLFMGPSGAGKSTIAKLLNEDGRLIILSDDRIAIRKVKDEFFIYGTPWLGTAGFVSNQKARLEKIFFIRHSNTNTINRLAKQESVSETTICSFLPFWESRFLSHSLVTMGELIQEISCFSLDFVPHRKVLDLVKSNL